MNILKEIVYRLYTWNDNGITTENNEETLFSGLEQIVCDFDLLKHYKKQAKIRSKEFNSENTVKAVEEGIWNKNNERDRFNIGNYTRT